MLSRRRFIQLGAAAGAGLILPAGLLEKASAFVLAAQSQPADPRRLKKYVDRLPVPGVMPASGHDGATTLYAVGAHQFQARVHSQIPPTTVWGYRSSGHVFQGPEQTYLGPSFVVRRGTPTRVTWNNHLGGLSHPLPVDPSLHWADPLKDSPPAGHTYPTATSRGKTTSTFSYTLTSIPMAPHVHGGEQAPGVDGGPDTWWTSGFQQTGPAFGSAGSASAHNVYDYVNTQPPATIWYHDHALGITRLNVYMGLAGAYVIYDPDSEPETADGARLPSAIDVETGEPGATDRYGQPYDVPLVIQDRMFDTAGQLWYPAVSNNPTVNPFWVPEFFGDTIMVNGKAWPHMPVEPRVYRLRLLNGSNARFYTLTFKNRTSGALLPFSQIATDGGYLGAATPLQRLTIAPGERAEILVDFGAMPGAIVRLENTARAPFPAGSPVAGATTRQVMEFRVDAGPATAVQVPTILDPALSDFPSIGSAPSVVRSLTLNEIMGPGGPLMAVLNNTMWPHGHGPMAMAPTTEFPILGATEVWEIINLTGDTHPIHLHLVQCQLLGRQAFDLKRYTAAYDGLFPGGMTMAADGPPLPYGDPGYTRDLTINGVARNGIGVVGGNPDVAPFLKGAPIPAPASERGWKDTIQMNPGEVTRILVRFSPVDGTAQYPFDATAAPGYVWHCHILDHEDNEMMRPFEVRP